MAGDTLLTTLANRNNVYKWPTRKEDWTPSVYGRL